MRDDFGYPESEADEKRVALGVWNERKWQVLEEHADGPHIAELVRNVAGLDRKVHDQSAVNRDFDGGDAVDALNGHLAYLEREHGDE